MHVTTNSKKEMLVHYCEFRSMGMATIAQKIIYSKYAWQSSQDGAQSSIRLYEVHQNISVSMVITFTNQYKHRYNSVAVAE